MKLLTVFATLLSVTVSLLSEAPALAHSGGLNAEGCHNDKKRGGYHCHRARAAPVQTLRAAPSGGAYANCKSARAAGAAPVLVGDPGYGPHLDRDGDGIGCE